MFRLPKFHTGNFEPYHFTRKLGVSYVKTTHFHVQNESFISENVQVPYIFHMSKNTCSFVRGKDLTTRHVILVELPFATEGRPKKNFNE